MHCITTLVQALHNPLGACIAKAFCFKQKIHKHGNFNIADEMVLC